MTLLKFTLMQYAIMKNESCCNDLQIIRNYFLFYDFHLNHNSRLIFPPCFSVLIPDFFVNFTFSLIAWFNVKLWVKMLTKLWNIDSGFSFCHCCQVWTIFAAFLTFSNQNKCISGGDLLLYTPWSLILNKLCTNLILILTQQQQQQQQHWTEWLRNFKIYLRNIYNPLIYLKEIHGYSHKILFILCVWKYFLTFVCNVAVELYNSV